MNRGVEDIGARIPDRAGEWEGLRLRLFEGVRAWERATARRDGIEREFAEDQLVYLRGPKQGQRLGAHGRRRRLRVLRALERRIALLEASLRWLEKRQAYLERHRI